MTPAEIIAAVQALTALLTEAVNIANLIKTAHQGSTESTTAQQVSVAVSAAAQALAKLSSDLKGP